ncbi:MAG: DUF2177 family protein [Candidatus Pacebacteria bacterium]|nr:DUF2177 family protein [Candidatus Paceibacterota bacterium]
MTFLQLLSVYLFTLATFFIIDMIWLGAVASKFYQKNLKEVIDLDFKIGPAVLFYVIFVLGLFIFVIEPAYRISDFSNAGIYGGLFGLIAYATYDLTNLSTIKKWPLKLVVIDIIWGAILGALTSLIGYFFFNLIIK